VKLFKETVFIKARKENKKNIKD